MYVPPPIKKPKSFNAGNPKKQERAYELPHVSVEVKDVLFTLIDAQAANSTPSLTVRVDDQVFNIIPRPHLYHFLMFLERRTLADIYSTMPREHLDAIFSAIHTYLFEQSGEVQSISEILPTIYSREQCLETPSGLMKSMIYMSEHYELTPISRIWMIDTEEGLVDLPQRKVLISNFTGDPKDRGLIDFILEYG